MDWIDDKHLSLTKPAVVKYLDTDLQNDPAVVKQLATNYGCCSSFRVLSEEGIRAMDLAVASIEKYAVCSPRIPKVLRGGTFRSKFLNGMGHSAAVLRQVSELAGCEMIYHPMKIHQLHINFKPDDDGAEGNGKKNVDRWHCDSTPFVLIVFATDPDEYTGGELQYFAGTREEGTKLLSSGAGLPADRVLNVGRQMKGYGVFMQGWRVFHQVTPVLTGDARTTVVYSFHPRNVLGLEACWQLSRTYNNVDPMHIFLSDWARFRSWKALRRLEICEENCGAELSAADTAVFAASKAKLASIVWTLPYTEDREYMRTVLTEAIAELRQHLQVTSFAETVTTADAGLPNLQLVVKEIDNCAEDIVTLKDSTMEYF
jgi:hypothetical protein